MSPKFYLQRSDARSDRKNVETHCASASVTGINFLKDNFVLETSILKLITKQNNDLKTCHRASR